MLYHVTYVSRSVRQVERQKIAEIVASAQFHNAKNGITGLLLVTGDYFVQSLEGSRKALTATMSRILSDPRHIDIEIVEMVPVFRRNFFSWDMYETIIPLEDPVLRQFATGRVFNPYELDPASLRELLIVASQHDKVP